MPSAPNPSTHSVGTIRAFGQRDNLRSAVRYALRAEVVITWTAQDGTTREARGYTRDISPGGAYVFSDVFPPVGRSVQLNVQLPMLPGEARVPCVNVRGSVLRVDGIGADAETGFAVRNEKVTLCSSST